jgi:uncharacterized integral membrane protein
MWFLKGLLSIGLLAGLLYLALLNSGQKVDVYITGPGAPAVNDVDLPIVLLASFVLGVLVWFFVSVFQVLSAKAEVATLKRKNRELLREISDLRNMTVRELDPDLLAPAAEEDGTEH